MSVIRYTNFDGLLNTGVSDFLLQNNELTACKNVWVYQLGKLQKVPGYEKVANAPFANAPNYLHYYYIPSTTTNTLLAFYTDGTDYKWAYRTTGNWTLQAPTEWANYGDSQPSVANYLGKAFIVGHKSGSTFLPNAAINETTFSTSDSDITNMPQGKFVVRYRDLLYVLYAKVDGTVYPSRAYYCDDPTGGSISWDNTDVNFVEFGYDDGDEITGAVDALDRLIVFKRFSMWKYDESSRIKIADIGCESYRSIVKINGIPYWSNHKGVWCWKGAYPELVSAKAQKFFDAIDQATLGDQVACMYNEEEYRLFIGDVTVDGYEYQNTWFCFNTRTENCYIRCTHHSATAACNYVQDNKRRAYFMADNKYLMRFALPVDEIYSDDGEEIDSFFITKALDHGVPEDVKFTNKITFFTKYANGMKCAVEKDNSGVFSEENIAILRKNVEEKNMSASANRFRYKFYEKSDSKSWEFEGFVVETDLKEE